MGIGSTAYQVVFYLHILSIIVGLGAVFFNAVYGSEIRKRTGAGAVAIAEANLRVSTLAKLFTYSIPIWGFGLIGLSDGVWEFSQTWVWLSTVLFALALGVATLVLFPTAKRQITLMKEMEAAGPPAGGPPPQVAELQANGKKLAMAGGFNHLALVVILALMIWKPGV
jgi:hypothetical protein